MTTTSRLTSIAAAIPLGLIILIGCGEPNNNSSDREHSLPIESQEVIIFESNRDGNFELYSIWPDGSNLTRITQNEHVDLAPSLSLDGSTLYYYSNSDGAYNIYQRDMSGSDDAIKLTDHPSADVLPEVSPDGKSIVFMSIRDSSSRDVFLMNVDGSNIRALTDNTDYEESASWSPDGTLIGFTRQLREQNDTSHASNGEIHVMQADGNQVKRLTRKPGYDSGAKFSPDGKQIAFYGEMNDLWDIYLMNEDGSELQNLTNDSIECYSPDWSPNGEQIVYTAGSNNNYNLWIINVKTGKKTQLTNTQKRDQGPHWGSIRISSHE